MSDPADQRTKTYCITSTVARGPTLIQGLMRGLYDLSLIILKAVDIRISAVRCWKDVYNMEYYGVRKYEEHGNAAIYSTLRYKIICY
jgi:hypothetical protein